VTWKQAAPGPVVLLTGPESLLADRAAAAVVDAVRSRHDQVEVSVLDAAGYEAGALGVLASPSLFEEHRVVTIAGLAEANDSAVADVTDYLSDPQPDVVLVLRHGGGVKARKLLDAAKSVPGAVWVDCPAIKRDTDLLTFVGEEFTRAGRRVSAPAAQLLVDAFGSDLRELASSCGQLIGDVEGDVDADHVRRYYGGRAEASGFDVADAVMARDAGRALLTLRQALDSGVDPIPLLAAIAMKVRTLAKVSVAEGPSGAVGKELGMPPWMVDAARRQLRVWTPDDLGALIVDIAAADLALKGGVDVGGRVLGRTADTVYTMERLVLTACGVP
jgi:DNA polymerase-3 subunit delta